MPHWLPAAVFGSAIAVFGFIMLRLNLRAWHDVSRDVELNQFDLAHFRQRYSRRAQLSGMLLTIGLMIAFGDMFIWGFGPAPAAAYWIVVILLGCWIALLALGDLTAVHAHSQVLNKRVEQQRKALEAELSEIQRRTRPANYTPHGEN